MYESERNTEESRGIYFCVAGFVNVSVSLEHGNELSGYIKCGHFLVWLHKYKLLKNGPVTWI